MVFNHVLDWPLLSWAMPHSWIPLPLQTPQVVNGQDGGVEVHKDSVMHPNTIGQSQQRSRTTNSSKFKNLPNIMSNNVILTSDNYY